MKNQASIAMISFAISFVIAGFGSDILTRKEAEK